MAAKKDLKYFMRSNEPEIVTVPGIERFKDENGNVIPLEIKRITKAEYQSIFDKYQRKEIAVDKRKKPVISGGEIAWKVTNDYDRALCHVLTEALQTPDLKAPELMEFYHCVDVTEMPLHVFPFIDEFEYVASTVLSVLGVSGLDTGADEELEEAKN